MNNMTTPCFPTLGEMAKYLFHHASLLPRKGEHSDGFFDEQTKKSFQTALARLAKEEGDFNENLIKVLYQFLDCINQIAPDGRISLAVEESLHDILMQYRHLIRNEGTYLSKKETIHWLLRARFIDRVVISTQKNQLRFNIKDTGLITPDEPYWFLPKVGGATVEWPLRSSLKWVYELIHTSQSRFHYPDESLEYENSRQSQNHQNASKWLNDKTFPNWGGIYSNVIASFDALKGCNDPRYQRNIGEQARQSILWVLFISRLTTSIGKDIEKHYGREYLADLIGHYMIQDKLLNCEAKALVATINSTIKTANISGPKIVNTVWDEHIPRLWLHISEKCDQADMQVQLLLRSKIIQDEIPKDLKLQLTSQYGEYAVSLIERNRAIQTKRNFPRMFPELYFKGESLRKNQATSVNDIEEYQSLVNKEQLQDVFQWLIAWIKASHLNRAEKYLEALDYYQEAFDLCRYAAGKNQNKLVNEYIEICSRTNQTKRREKAIAWAEYLDVELEQVVQEMN